MKGLATTALTVFELAMALLDEIQDNGQVNTQNTNEYKAKTPRLITILEFDLCRRQGITPTPITAITDNVNSTDDVAYRILPYGLASVLLLVENPTLANFYQQRYEELRKQIPTTWETIENVYADGGDV